MKRPLIIAHRGASREAPENTLAAFEKALAHGADGIELDLRLSRDRELVITHNENLFELTGVKKRVHSLTVSELKKIDFGSHFSSRFKNEQIPTLEEVFDLTKGRALLNLEIKGTKIWGDGREDRLIELVKKWGLEDQVLISSFNIFSLRRLYRRAPHLKRGYLFFERQDPISRKAGWAKAFLPYSLHVSRHLLHKLKPAKIHERGYRCWVWTVNDWADLEKDDLPFIDAIITDVPKEFSKLNHPRL